jgi:hypothetical protein
MVLSCFIFLRFDAVDEELWVDDRSVLKYG